MPKQKRPPPREKPPVTQEDYIKDTHRRAVRMETRLGRVMERLGLDSHGDPIQPTPSEAPVRN